jgi:ankyrin
VKDPHSEALGRIAFMREPKSSRQEAPQTPICNLNVALPDNITPEPAVPTEVDLVSML